MNLEKLKTTLALLGLTIVVLTTVDLLGRAAWGIDQRFFDPPVVDLDSGAQDERQFSAAYDIAGYDVTQLFREFHATERIVYEPYIIWDRRFYRGELINIDIEGFRKTTNNSEADDVMSVWMFGGSTMWGEGAPDDETIPSYLSEMLNAWGVDTVVKNLGERGFVSTQELVFLYRELQAGRRPDVVVFYDGINDTAAASNWPELPGSHVSRGRIRDRFEFGEVPSEERRELVQSLGIYKASRILLDRLDARGTKTRFQSDDEEVNTQPKFLDANFEFLGNQAVRIWLANHELVSALANEFGFTFTFVLQPSLWTEGKPLHPSEKRILAEEFDSRAMTHIMATRAEMSSIVEERLRNGSLPPNVYNLANVFDKAEGPLYIDYVHTAGPGNRIVGKALYDVLVGQICQEPPRNVTNEIGHQIEAACE